MYYKIGTTIAIPIYKVLLYLVIDLECMRDEGQEECKYAPVQVKYLACTIKLALLHPVTWECIIMYNYTMSCKC